MSGLIAGYLMGLTIGFTVFDPDWDVWALLGALLAVCGTVAGLLPAARRYATVTLGAITGYYAGMLIDLTLFLPSNDAGLLAALQHSSGMILILGGAVLGAVIGWRLRNIASAKAVLAGLVLGGFLIPLLILPTTASTSEAGLVPIVLGGGLLGGAVAHGLFRWSATRH